VSAVPAGLVIERELVLGIMYPAAAIIGTTIRVVRLPGIPPMQCLSMMGYLSILSVSLNVTLSFYFVQNLHLEVWGLGASYAISSNFAFLLLLYFLHHKVGGFNLNDLFMPTLKMLLAAVVAAVALYIPIKALDQLVFDTTHTINLILLTGIASIFGLGVYLLLVWLLKVRELETFGQLIRRIYKFKFELKSEEIVQHPDTV